MHRRFRQVFTALKEHSSVSYAKIATVGGLCDIDHIIVKATAPDDLPLPEKYIHELLKIFSVSSSSFRSFAINFTCRFSKTRCWRVALKCLLLLHRLLRLLPECSPLRTELLWARSNDLVSFYPCYFRDDSSSTPEAYTLFIRSYAHLLDEALDCCYLDDKETYYGDQMSQDFAKKMKEITAMLEVLPQIQSLIDRVMDCRPTGAAARSFILQSTMKYIIRDSFICYTTFRTQVVLLLDNLFQMPYRNCMTAFGIYKRAASQANQLCEFYDWCKAKGFCGSYEYPFIDRIPQIQIRALENFINGMWQLTESSSSTTSPLSVLESKSSSAEDDGYTHLLSKDLAAATSYQWEEFGEEGKPLILFKDRENDSWETLLEASVNLSRVPRSDLLCFEDFSSGCGYGYGTNHGYQEQEVERTEKDKWMMQLHNPNVSNPFSQPDDL
ncbi:hypothetical protein HS088_TW03G00412 [Tripterygium wilfordii]|uniref:ENTH domain-containing protein n=1 Tax=Tripterygium wilfordii TaxID=458696 RepID=A0A7J7DUN7_TRIWF|nr:putative clathrin assembly protein At2g25430 [Tripterygium wilfordii]KAF5750080.1 hypothetical protein HS088_TW03G00412 [Tripterygium wilfordii]